ncbi:MAG: hypothetical protein OHK0040_07690 [bacterium]
MTLLGFFYLLRLNGIKITTKEWLDLYRLLSAGEINSLDDLYFKGKKVLVKSEKLYDIYDKAYLEFVQSGGDIKERLEEILSFMELEVSARTGSLSENLAIEEILNRFSERLLNQMERHSGGGRHIGQRGYSPFGNAGVKRDGIRVGGESHHNAAFMVASKRSFKNLREDVYLDGRNIGVALKKLRHFQNIGREEEVNIQATIDKTAENFGEIEIVFEKERKNNVKLLLLIDNGGSMEIHEERVEKLFSIAKSLNYFKEFKHFYFHNCIYDFIYEDIENEKKVPTERLFKEFNADWKVILIGDALMSPYELHNSWHMIYRYERKGKTGIEWLNLVKNHFRNAVWLNPVAAVQWQHQTVKAIAKIFPMFPLTVSGIEASVKELLKQ